MPKKTITVKQIREWANTRLAIPNSSHRIDPKLSPEQAFRLGVASFVEQVLHGTGNYKGFGYQLSEGEKFEAGKTDETRRIYY